MVTQVRADSLYQIRQSGATLQEIASPLGISREAVRRRLIRRYGSTRIQDLLTTAELVRLVGCTYSIDKLQRRGVIQPAMVVGRGRMLWEPGTIAAVIIYIDSLRCPVCHQLVPSNRRVYCSRGCYLEAHRYKNQPEEKKRRQDERVKRWLAEHPGIQQEKQRRYRARRSLERYQTTDYVIWRRCSIPLGTVVRVLSLSRGKMKVEWGDQMLEVPFCCVRRMNGVINYG